MHVGFLIDRPAHGRMQWQIFFQGTIHTGLWTAMPWTQTWINLVVASFDETWELLQDGYELQY
jgi:hypothetical protein